MQAPKDLLRAATITTMELSEVLSPESFVFVALMSVEEGPNKASFLPVVQVPVVKVMPNDLPSRPLAVELPR